MFRGGDTEASAEHVAAEMRRVVASINEKLEELRYELE